MTQVKICGIKSAAAFDAVVEAGADYLGFNFFEPSPRFVTPEHAASLDARHVGGPRRVGLFVAPPLEAVEAVLQTVRLDILQIYGSAELCRQIRAEFGLAVWRAIGVASESDLPAEDPGLEGFVIEARPPANATRPGGNATVMDWNLLEFWRPPEFWLLAGGLNAGNVNQAIAISGAPAVDVSSGVEHAPGEKSPSLIQEFVASIRQAAAF